MGPCFRRDDVKIKMTDVRRTVQNQTNAGRSCFRRAIMHSTSPGMQVRQTSGRAAWITHEVATPIWPDNAEQRSPSQRMPDSLALTNFSGMRSSAASSSVVNRGQFCEYEQQAPQAWHGLSESMAGRACSMHPA